LINDQTIKSDKKIADPLRSPMNRKIVKFVLVQHDTNEHKYQVSFEDITKRSSEELARQHTGNFNTSSHPFFIKTGRESTGAATKNSPSRSWDCLEMKSLDAPFTTCWGQYRVTWQTSTKARMKS
jgi:hypothetical protein